MHTVTEVYHTINDDIVKGTCCDKLDRRHINYINRKHTIITLTITQLSKGTSPVENTSNTKIVKAHNIYMLPFNAVIQLVN